jgi:serine/threonine-protein kinase
MLDQLFEVHSSLMTAPPTGSTPTQRTMVMPSAAAAIESTAETQVLGSRGSRPAATQGAVALADPVTALAAKSQKRRARTWWIVGLIVVLVGAAAGVGWYFGIGPGSQTTIPESIAGMTIEQATAELNELGLVVDPTTGSIDSPTVAVGAVAQTTPAIGSPVVKGGSVQLLVSTGPKPLTVPAFVGMTEAEARAAIEAAPFTLVEPVIYQFDAAIAKGLVVNVLGADGASILEAGTYGDRQPVTLIISAGAVPDVACKTVEEATQILAGVKLTAETGKEEFNDCAAGTVAMVDPEPDADGNPRVFREGDKVDLVISRGPDLVQVPDVIGDNIAAAKAELEGLGFVVLVDSDIQEIFWSFPPAVVTDQSPAGGEMAKRGSEVTIFG